MSAIKSLMPAEFEILVAETPLIRTQFITTAAIPSDLRWSTSKRANRIGCLSTVKRKDFDPMSSNNINDYVTLNPNLDYELNKNTHRLTSDIGHHIARWSWIGPKILREVHLSAGKIFAPAVAEQHQCFEENIHNFCRSSAAACKAKPGHSFGGTVVSSRQNYGYGNVVDTNCTGPLGSLGTRRPTRCCSGLRSDSSRKRAAITVLMSWAILPCICWFLKYESRADLQSDEFGTAPRSWWSGSCSSRHHLAAAGSKPDPMLTLHLVLSVRRNLSYWAYYVRKLYEYYDNNTSQSNFYDAILTYFLKLIRTTYYAVKKRHDICILLIH